MKEQQCHSTPPTGNVKCIVFTLMLAGGYWFLPQRNKWVLLGLVFLPYIAMAWYDHVYGCEKTFGPTFLMAFYEWAKPPEGKQRQSYDNWCPEVKNTILFVDFVIALGLIALTPAFLNWNPQ